MSTKAVVDKDLRRFAQEVTPNQEFLDKAREAVDTIVRRLQEESKFGIDRPYTAGSIGKKTSTNDSDCDEVLFVNIDSIAQIKEVLDDFENILQNAKLPGKLGEIKKTRFSIQFKYDGFEMDFLPAINFFRDYPKPRKPELAAQQALKALEQIKKDPSKAYHYSSALVESALRFMAEQSGNIHTLARICKKWDKSLSIKEGITGRSTLIELIAVYAGQKEEKKNKENGEEFSLLNGFKEFLRLVGDFPQLQIVDFGFDPLKGSGKSMKDLTDGQGAAGLHEKNVRPLVIEPANPFNNIAQLVKDKEAVDEVKKKEAVMAKYQTSAKETLAKLAELEKLPANKPVSVDSLFAPKK